VPPTLLAQADDVNRIGVLFAAVHESLVGTFRTSRDVQVESAFRDKAEVGFRTCQGQLLAAQSGHSALFKADQFGSRSLELSKTGL
jgi:hypothetical protein